MTELIERMGMHERDCVRAADMETDVVLCPGQIADIAKTLNESATTIATLQSQLAARDQELAEIREILFGCLDRDRDNITTRNLAAVASNALSRSREELAEARKDAERFRWLKANVQPWKNDNEKPHALIEICIGDVQNGIGWLRIIGPESHVGIITLDAAVDTAIDAADGEDGQ